MSKPGRNIGRKFGAFHKSRELAVQFLYSLDALNRSDEDFNENLELFLSLSGLSDEKTETEIKQRCKNLVSKVWNKKDEIDEALLKIVTGWRPERMVIVDREILRLMIFEGFLEKTLPVRSAITEAVKLANDFGTKDSARFVNGVMCKAEKFFEQENKEN